MKEENKNIDEHTHTHITKTTNNIKLYKIKFIIFFGKFNYSFYYLYIG